MRKLKLVRSGKLTEKSWGEYYVHMATMPGQPMSPDEGVRSIAYHPTHD